MHDTVGPTGTREAILESAEREFGRHGYSRATIGAIADGAGVSRPLVHRYFGDKGELFRAVVERVLRQWNDALVEVAERSAPTTAHTIGALGHACIEWAHERQMLRGVLVRDHDTARRIAGDEIEAGRNRLPVLLEHVLAAGIERGDIRSDLDAATMAWVLTEVIAAGALQSMSSDTQLVAQRTRAMVEVVLHGVVLSPGAS